jgi:hypothetical protein
MPDPQIVSQFISQSDLIGHSFVWQYQLQLSDLHFHELHSRLGTTDILSDPAFVIQPNDPLQPAQLALQWNIIAQTWPQVGGFILQTMLQGGVQWSGPRGDAVTLQPGFDISNVHLDWFHVQGGLQLTFSQGGDGNLQVEAGLPVATVVSIGAQF